LNDIYDRLVNNHENVKNECITLKKENNDFKNPNEKCNKEIFDLKTEIEKLKSKNPELTIQNIRLNNKIHQKTTEIDELNCQYEKMVNEKSEIELNLGVIKQELIQIKKTITEKENEISKRDKLICRLKIENLNLKDPNSVSHNKRNTTTLENELLQNGIERIESMFNKLNNNIGSEIPSRLNSTSNILSKNMSNLLTNTLSNNMTNNINQLSTTVSKDTMSVCELIKVLLNICTKFQIESKLTELSKCFRRLLELDPNDSEFKFYYAASIDKEKLLNVKFEAEKYYSDVINKIKNENEGIYIWAIFNLGNLYLSFKTKEDTEKARLCFKMIKSEYEDYDDYYETFIKRKINKAIKILNQIEKGKTAVDILENPFLKKKKHRILKKKIFK